MFTIIMIKLNLIRCVDSRSRTERPVIAREFRCYCVFFLRARGISEVARLRKFDVPTVFRSQSFWSPKLHAGKQIEWQYRTTA